MEEDADDAERDDVDGLLSAILAISLLTLLLSLLRCFSRTPILAASFPLNLLELPYEFYDF